MLLNCSGLFFIHLKLQMTKNSSILCENVRLQNVIIRLTKHQTKLQAYAIKTGSDSLPLITQTRVLVIAIK